MTLLIKACPHRERLVILREAKNPVSFLAKLTGFFVASLLRMTEPKGHLNGAHGDRLVVPFGKV